MEKDQDFHCLEEEKKGNTKYNKPSQQLQKMKESQNIQKAKNQKKKKVMTKCQIKAKLKNLFLKKRLLLKDPQQQIVKKRKSINNLSNVEKSAEQICNQTRLLLSFKNRH